MSVGIRKDNDAKGFTLVELSIALAILAGLLLMIVTTFIALLKYQQSVISLRTTNQTVRTAFTTLSTDGRVAKDAVIINDGTYDQVCLYQTSKMIQYYVAKNTNNKYSIFASEKGIVSGCNAITVIGAGDTSITSLNTDVVQFQAWRGTLGNGYTVSFKLGIATDRNQLIAGGGPTGGNVCQGALQKNCSVTVMETSVSLKGVSDNVASLATPIPKPVVATSCQQDANGFSDPNYMQNGYRQLCFSERYQANYYTYVTGTNSDPVVDNAGTTPPLSSDHVAVKLWSAGEIAHYGTTYISSTPNPHYLYVRMRQDYDAASGTRANARVSIAKNNGAPINVNFDIGTYVSDKSYNEYRVDILSLGIKDNDYVDLSIRMNSDSCSGCAPPYPGGDNDMNILVDNFYVSNTAVVSSCQADANNFSSPSYYSNGNRQLCYAQRYQANYYTSFNGGDGATVDNYGSNFPYSADRQIARMLGTNSGAHYTTTYLGSISNPAKLFVRMRQDIDTGTTIQANMTVSISKNGGSPQPANFTLGTSNTDNSYAEYSMDIGTLGIVQGDKVEIDVKMNNDSCTGCGQPGFTIPGGKDLNSYIDNFYLSASALPAP